MNNEDSQSSPTNDHSPKKIMKTIQHTKRNFADEDFQQSLNQLEDIIQSQDELTTESNNSNSIHDVISKYTDIGDLDAWEDAVADIERYLQQKTNSRKNS